MEEAERRETEEAERQERLRREAEAERIAHEAEAARRLKEERIEAVNHRFVDLRGTLEELHCSQQKSLRRRHDIEMKRVKEDMISSQLAFDDKWALERAWMKKTNQDMIDQLSTEQEAAKRAMEIAHEKEEDEIFLDLRLHLRNKSNREARQNTIAERIRKAQTEQLQRLENQQAAAREQMFRHEALETEKLEVRLLRERESEKNVEVKNAETIARKVFADRMWFDTLVDERRGMLDLDETRLLQMGANIDTYSGASPDP